MTRSRLMVARNVFTPARSSNTGCIARARAGNTVRAPRRVGVRCRPCETSASQRHPGEVVLSAWRSAPASAGASMACIQHASGFPLVHDDLIAWRKALATQSSGKDDRATSQSHDVGRWMAAARREVSSATRCPRDRPIATRDRWRRSRSRQQCRASVGRSLCIAMPVHQPGRRTLRVARTGRSTLTVRRVDRRSGKRRLLSQRQPLVLPRHDRRDKEVDPESVGAAEVDRIAILRVVLHAGARATPERPLGRVEQPHVSRPRRLEVRHHAALGILRGEDAVVQRALVVVEVRRRTDRPGTAGG